MYNSLTYIFALERMNMEQFKEENNGIMSAMKYLVFVVDGTAATGPYWKNIFSDYLEKIIRYINRQTEQDHEAMLWLGFVLYGAHGYYNTDFTVQTWPWTRNVNMFLEQLSSLNFSGGGNFIDPAIADGLAEALVLYPKPQIGADESFVKQHGSAEKHCVLVAASNPTVVPTRLWLPIVKDGLFLDIQTESRNVDFEDVAKIFAECSVSLSLISPKHLPRLKKIFNVGNDVRQDFVASHNNVDYNPQGYLILLSERFPEIHAAFNEELMMTAGSPSPASVEGQVKFMEPKPETAGKMMPDEDMKFVEQMVDEYLTTDMQEDYIYPDETFTVMPGIVPHVPNSSSTDFTGNFLSIEQPSASMEFPSDNGRIMMHEATLASGIGITQSNLDEQAGTLMTPAIAIEAEETLAQGAGFWATQERHQNFVTSTPVQPLEPERSMMTMEMAENTAPQPPFLFSEIFPTHHQVYYNFQPGEIEMVKTVCQTGGQITTDSIVVSSVLSENSNIDNSHPVWLQSTHITGEIGSQPVTLSSGVEPEAILGIPSGVEQLVPGLLISSGEHLRAHQATAVDLVGNPSSPQAAVSAVPGLDGNLSFPQAPAFGFVGNVSGAQATVFTVPGFAGDLSVPQAESTDLDRNFGDLPSAPSGLAGNLSDAQAAVSAAPGVAGNQRAPQAATLTAPNLAEDLWFPQAGTNPGLVENFRAPQAAHYTAPGLGGNLRFSQDHSCGFANVPCSSDISGQLQPRTTFEIVGEQDGFGNNQNGVGSNTEEVGGQSPMATTIGSVIERDLQVHGGMEAIGLTNLNNEQDGYVLSWQGNINGQHRGKTLSLGQAKAYRKLSASASLTADWPQTILMSQVLKQTSVYGLQYMGVTDIVVFATMANQRLYEELKNKDYCVRMDLPSQTMILLPMHIERCFIGALFRGHIPQFMSDKSLQQKAQQEPETDNTRLDGRTSDCMHDEEVENALGTNNQHK